MYSASAIRMRMFLNCNASYKAFNLARWVHSRTLVQMYVDLIRKGIRFSFVSHFELWQSFYLITVVVWCSQMPLKLVGIPSNKNESMEYYGYKGISYSLFHLYVKWTVALPSSTAGCRDCELKLYSVKQYAKRNDRLRYSKLCYNIFFFPPLKWE